jgi:hypothetical protein
MNNYISLDGLKYYTPNKYWSPVEDKPATIRQTLLGATDVTYGPAVFCEWRGQIEGPVTPKDGTWGSITTLRTTIAKMVAVAFVDHYGTGMNVHALGPFQERSLSPRWDSASNSIYVTVRIVKA